MAAIEQRYDRVADLACGFAKLWIAGVVGLNVVVGVAALVAGPTVLEGCLQAVARYSVPNTLRVGVRIARERVLFAPHFHEFSEL